MAKKHCVRRWVLAHLAFSPSLINLYALERVIRSFDIIVLIFSSLMSGEARGLSDRFHDCLDSILKGIRNGVSKSVGSETLNDPSLRLLFKWV